MTVWRRMAIFDVKNREEKGNKGNYKIIEKVCQMWVNMRLDNGNLGSSNGLTGVEGLGVF